MSQFSKILEKIFSIKLSNILNHCEILSPAQFRFRQTYSTPHALLNLCQMTYESIANKLSTLGIFIDLQKAFDTVNHVILLKMSSQGSFAEVY